MKTLGFSRWFIAALVAFATLAAARAETVKPKVMGVLFYADWCGSCKVLEPKLTAIKKEFAGAPVVFTRVDQTDAFTKEQSAMLAELLGVREIYQEQAGKTGYMLLIDTKTHRVLDKLTKDKSEDELKAAINKAVKS